MACWEPWSKRGDPDAEPRDDWDWEPDPTVDADDEYEREPVGP